MRKRSVLEAPYRARNIWYMICQRCTNPNSPSYKHYGGRGIRLRWSDFDSFWTDMAATYEETLKIERIDNNGDYNKNNCMWATHKEQCQNRRTCIYIDYKGERKNMKQWATELGLNYQTLATRINELEWEPERALATAARKIKSHA